MTVCRAESRREHYGAIRRWLTGVVVLGRNEMLRKGTAGSAFEERRVHRREEMSQSRGETSHPRRTRSGFWIQCVGILLLATPLPNCSRGDEPSSSAEPVELERVVYAGSAWYGHAPVWAGQRLGIFRKHGFQIDRRAFGGSADRINALIADNATFASLGEVAMLAAMASERRDFYWVGSQNIAPGNEGLVSVGVDSVEQLAGRKIALYQNTSVHLTVALLLRQAGLDIRRDVEVLNAPDSAVVDLVRSGEADAGAIWEPFFSDLRALPNARVLGTDQDTSIYHRYRTMTGPDVLCASRSWVDADPERAKRLFRAYFEAVEWAQAHPVQLTEIVLAEVRQPRAAVEAALHNFRWIGWNGQRAMLSNARMFGQAQEVSELLVELGRIRRVPSFRDWTVADWYWE